MGGWYGWLSDTILVEIVQADSTMNIVESRSRVKKTVTGRRSDASLFVQLIRACALSSRGASALVVISTGTRQLRVLMRQVPVLSSRQ
jgi:hypothetical protein